MLRHFFEVLNENPSGHLLEYTLCLEVAIPNIIDPTLHKMVEWRRVGNSLLGLCKFFINKIPITIKLTNFIALKTYIHYPNNCWKATLRYLVRTSTEGCEVPDERSEDCEEISTDMQGRIYDTNSNCNIIHIMKVTIMLLYKELKKHKILNMIGTHLPMPTVCCTANNANEQFFKHRHRIYTKVS